MMLFSLLGFFVCVVIFKKSGEDIYRSCLLFPQTLTQICKSSDPVWVSLLLFVFFFFKKERKTHFGSEFEGLSRNKTFWTEGKSSSVIGIDF